MVHCPICQADRHPTHDMQADGRIVQVCGTCNAPLALHEGNALSAAEPAKTDVAPPQAPTPPAIAGRVSFDVPVLPVPAEPLDPIAVIDARVAWLEKETARLATLQRELKALRRMRAAAGPRAKRHTNGAAISISPDGNVTISASHQ